MVLHDFSLASIVKSPDHPQGRPKEQQYAELVRIVAKSGEGSSG